MKVTTPNFPPIRQLQEATSILHAIPPEIAQEVQDARNQFFLWFFGASGGAGIARSAFPRMFNQVRYIQSLKNVSPTRGEETIGLSPLCGYPQDLAVKDVEQVVNNPMSVEQIVKKYPVEGNFLTIKGYLAFSAFSRANQNANPAAVRAVFDTFAQSTDLSDPFVAQEKLDSYKEDVRRLNGALLKSKLTGYLSIASLLFLLGLADVIAFGHAKDGWFYYWTPEDGILNLPKFWI
ncbi:hypothetical protein IV203_028823 [Nitzschia inconspicua]|uniref:Uncharacterized protein n=1 Tax=Nitzschia inconspicua TaxID=303405 RepID=A0A9K3LQK4_9STRA|nr:hypothetical protein IV203_028823 [Nitzschia inconspicua]